MATARAAADFLGVPLFKYLGNFHASLMPVPMANIINAGARRQLGGLPGVHDHARGDRPSGKRCA